MSTCLSEAELAYLFISLPLAGGFVALGIIAMIELWGLGKRSKDLRKRIDAALERYK